MFPEAAKFRHGGGFVKTVLDPHFGIGEFTTHSRTYSSGDWDVNWGYRVLTHGHILIWFLCLCQTSEKRLVGFLRESQ